MRERISTFPQTATPQCRHEDQEDTRKTTGKEQPEGHLTKDPPRERTSTVTSQPKKLDRIRDEIDTKRTREKKTAL